MSIIKCYKDNWKVRKTMNLLTSLFMSIRYKSLRIKSRNNKIS